MQCATIALGLFLSLQAPVFASETANFINDLIVTLDAARVAMDHISPESLASRRLGLGGFDERDINWHVTIELLTASNLLTTFTPHFEQYHTESIQLAAQHLDQGYETLKEA